MLEAVLGKRAGGLGVNGIIFGAPGLAALSVCLKG